MASWASWRPFWEITRVSTGCVRDKQGGPTFTLSPFSSSSSGIGKSLLGTGLKSCAKLEKLLLGVGFTELAPRSDAFWAGEDAGSRALLLDGVAGDDFWKKPRIDFWLFMFWALEVVFFRAEGGVAEGDSAEALAIVGYSIQKCKRICSI